MAQGTLTPGAFKRLRTKGRTGTPEGRVLRACLELLKLRGVLAWRSNNAPIPIRQGAAITGLRPTLAPGLPDVLGVLPGGILLAVECKAPGGALRPSQRAFLTSLENAGAVVVVARCARDLDEAIGRYLMSSRQGQAVNRVGGPPMT